LACIIEVGALSKSTVLWKRPVTITKGVLFVTCDERVDKEWVKKNPPDFFEIIRVSSMQGRLWMQRIFTHSLEEANRRELVDVSKMPVRILNASSPVTI
jgi:hypothetical protein